MERIYSPEAKNEQPNISIEQKFAHVYLIMLEGKKIGEVEIPTDLSGDTFAISDIHLDEQYRGQGLGVATYKALIEKLDKPLETFGANPEAINVWESLARQGLAKKTEYGYVSISKDTSKD